MNVNRITDFIYDSICLTGISKLLAGMLIALRDMKSPSNKSYVMACVITVILVFIMVLFVVGEIRIAVSFKNVVTLAGVIVATLVLTVPAKNMDNIISKTAEYGIEYIKEYETVDELKSFVYEADNAMKCILTGVMAEQALSAKIESGVDVDLEEEENVYAFSNFMRKLGMLYLFITYSISMFIMGIRGLLNDDNCKAIVIKRNKRIQQSNNIKD